MAQFAASAYTQFEQGPYVVAYYTLHNGEPVDVHAEAQKWQSSEKAESLRCSELIHQHSDLAKAWWAVPLEAGGTLSTLNGYADGGKTGTTEPSYINSEGSAVIVKGGTNAAWTVSVVDEGVGYALVTNVIGKNNGVNIGSSAAGGGNAGPMARSVIQVLRSRERADKLIEEDYTPEIDSN